MNEEEIIGVFSTIALKQYGFEKPNFIGGSGGLKKVGDSL